LLRGAACRRKFDLSLDLLDPLHQHLDRIPEPVGPAAAPADQRRSELVELEIVARQPARRQVALEDLAEADEEAGADCPDDLPLEGILPAPLEQCGLQQPGKAELVGQVLDLGRLALAYRRA